MTDPFEQTTWTEVEEKRRVWWAIYILDRVISLGSRRRFSFPEPLDGHVLPASDEAWVNCLPPFLFTEINREPYRVLINIHILGFGRCDKHYPILKLNPLLDPNIAICSALSIRHVHQSRRGIPQQFPDGAPEPYDCTY